MTRLLLVLSLFVFLAACESSEERAESYFKSGMELLEEGDVERALLEFKNVFQFNPSHREARQTYARIVREQGQLQEAYGQYLRLVEQYPEDLEGRQALAEMAFLQQQWEEFDRHSVEAIALAPDDVKSQILQIVTDYRTAEEDNALRRDVLRAAEALAETQSNDPILRLILIDGYLKDQEFDAALVIIDDVIAADPTNRRFYDLKLRLLDIRRDVAGLETLLRDIIARFPKENQPKVQLVQLLSIHDRVDDARAFLNEVSDPAAVPPTDFVILLRFIQETEGLEAARNLITEAIDTGGPNTTDFHIMRARIDVDLGQNDTANANLRTLLGELEAGDTNTPTAIEQLNNVRITLARIELAEGNSVGSRALVEAALAADPSNVGGLKLQAGWLINEDKPDEAIAVLRNALDQRPNEAEALMLMSSAHARGGNLGLSKDFLSLAVNASGNAPNESIQYASLLISEKRYLPAEDTLLASLRKNSNHVGILALLGRLYSETGDVGRARQVVNTLQSIDSEPARLAAGALNVSLLNQDGDTEEVISALQDLAEETSENYRIHRAIVRTHLSGGDTEEALEYIDAKLETDPNPDEILFLRANTLVAMNQLDGAITDFEVLIEKRPEWAQVWLGLSRALALSGQNEKAEDIIKEGLQKFPQSIDLAWAKATVLENRNDIEGAIAIYEEIYEENTQSTLVANNLASLLATYRTDEESLARAYAVARRLRDTEVPAFQDTYGWIAFRRGDLEEAQRHLEPAARALTSDVIVQFHLGKLYLAQNKTDAALQQFRRVLAFAEDGDPRVQIEEARTHVEELSAEKP